MSSGLMSAPRWERARAAWVLQRAGRSAATRRRGELLLRRALTRERARVGAAENTVTTVVTPNMFVRAWHREDGLQAQLGWVGAYVLATVVAVVLAGPGLLVGAGIYGLLWLVAPVTSVKPVRTPFLLVAVVGAFVAVMWFLVGDFPTPGARIAHTMWLLQIPIAGVTAAWLTRAWGWEAVTGTSASTAPAPVLVAQESADAVDAAAFAGADVPNEVLREMYRDLEGAAQKKKAVEVEGSSRVTEVPATSDGMEITGFLPAMDDTREER